MGVALMLATLCNGATSYISKMTVSSQEYYTAYLTTRCAQSMHATPPDSTDPLACGRLTPGATSSSISINPLGITNNGLDILSAGFLLKLVKDLLGLGFIFGSIYLIVRRRAPVVNIKVAWALTLLIAYSTILFFVSILFNGVLIGLVGARSMIFLFFAVVGQWFARHIDYLANCAGVLILIEALLMFAEVFQGVIISDIPFHFPLNIKPSGTLTLSNSAGTFAVAALAFYHAFSPARSHFFLLIFLVIAMVLLSGSATGILCIALFLFAILISNMVLRWRLFLVFACLASGAGLFLFLPEVTGRPDLFIGSLGTRLDRFFTALLHRDMMQTIFGSGLGVNTNAALTLFGQGKVFSGLVTGQGGALPLDSTVTSFLVQIGIVGTLLFYLVLYWAAANDSKARLFYLIIAVSSLTLNINEVFPVNYLLGFALAHSAWQAQIAMGSE